jgi:N-acetyl sugar amidotransferase
MDSTAPDISFDEDGACSYCAEFLEVLAARQRHADAFPEELDQIVSAIRAAGKGKPYDCVLGVSGGLDSSYALHAACRLGLRPLAVHMDNGWNSELAVSNIERLVKSLGVDLFTYVLDWPAFRELQRAFFRAHVVDIEMLTDNAIMGALYEVGRRRGIRYILLGTNTANEGMRMPPGWNHLKLDRRNVQAIYRRFGEGGSLRGVPLIGMLEYALAKYLRRVKAVPILEYVPYDTREATRVLQGELGWRPYDRKHYESVFTRFYQGFILPAKFNVDKRKVHFSTLICSGEMSRQEALDLMGHGPYQDQGLLRADREFVLKKLGFTEEELERYLAAPPVPHAAYPSVVPALAVWKAVKHTVARAKPSA